VPGGISIYPGDPTGGGATTTGSGSTEAVDSPVVAPNADGFICAMRRVDVRSVVQGWRVRITDPGADPIPDCTLVGTLRVVDGDTGDELVAPLIVFDPANAVLPEIGPLTVPYNLSPGFVGATERLDLIWNETGAIGGGTRPSFMFINFATAAQFKERF
jgi:hypothetical protein